jgi:hypothetical protein
MTAIAILTNDRSPVDITESDMDGLRSRLRGAVLAQGDDGYEAARHVWNGNIDRGRHSSPAAPESPTSSRP